jgi:hypothetical protein
VPKWLKIVLGLVLASVLLCGGAFGAMMWWFDANKEELKADAERLEAEGRGFGAKTDWDGCLDEGVKRSRACETDNPFAAGMCGAKVGFFFEACMGAAAEVPARCDGIPSTDSLLAFATWSVAECEARGQGGSQPCTKVMQKLAEYCASR